MTYSPAISNSDRLRPKAARGFRSGSVAVSRVASSGLAVVLVLLAGFALGGAMVSNRRAAEVSRAAALNDQYRAARLAVGAEESLERKYRLEPSPEVRARYDKAVADLEAALGAVVDSGDQRATGPARDALAEHGPYLDAIDRMFAAVDARDTASVLEIDGGEVDPHFERIDELVNQGADAQEEVAKVALARLRATESTFVVMTPIVFALGFILLGLFTLAIRSYRRRINHQALHDALTGLPNRTLLLDRATQALAAAQRTGVSTAVFLIDLDRFKEINDTLGHHYGDLVLTAIGERLREAIRDSDTVARLGGDEFAVVFTNVSGTDDVAQLADRLLATIKEPIAIGELSFEVEASIGIATAPDDAGTAQELVQRADVAMYVAKSTHTGYSLYEPGTDQHSPARLAMLGDLRRAIETDQLVLYYQPKNHLPGGTMGGVEALVRWQHPERGLVPPDEFIPLAEHTSLIEPLTTWVLREAMSQARRWVDAGLEIPVAINISTRSLTDLGFAGHVKALIDETGVAATLIELEVTETSIMADPDRARRVLHDLHDLGIRLSIDDFGTGYSSLAYLRTLPVNALKIDRSFIRNMQHEIADAVIVRSVIELAHNLGLDVIAEGVEDAATAADLARNGCAMAQGYYWSRPVPSHELLNWHDQNARRV